MVVIWISLGFYRFFVLIGIGGIFELLGYSGCSVLKRNVGDWKGKGVSGVYFGWYLLLESFDVSVGFFFSGENGVLVWFWLLLVLLKWFIVIFFVVYLIYRWGFVCCGRWGEFF